MSSRNVRSLRCRHPCLHLLLHACVPGGQDDGVVDIDVVDGGDDDVQPLNTTMLDIVPLDVGKRIVLMTLMMLMLVMLMYNMNMTILNMVY